MRTSIRAECSGILLTRSHRRICPFCYVGLRRIQSAIAKVQAKHSDVRVDIQFAPFLLDPSLPTAGTDKRGRYIEKYGAARFETMEKEMVARGKLENIDFSYGGLISSTLACHRLVEKALQLKGPKGQVALVENLFAACEYRLRSRNEPS